MTITRWSTLCLVFAVCGVVAWIVFTLVAGMWLPYVPWTASVAIVLVVAAILIFGWQVRQYSHGSRPDIDSVWAARLLFLAKACSLGGAGLVGFYAAQVVVLWTHTAQPGSDGRVWSGVAAAVSSVACSAAGLIVEHFCKLPPQNGENADNAQAPA